MALDIEHILQSLGKKYTNRFMYNDKPMPIEQLFSLKGGLPMLARRANTLSDFLFNGPTMATFVADDEALTGERLSIDDEEHVFLLLMLLYDVVEEMVANSSGGDVIVS